MHYGKAVLWACERVRKGSERTDWEENNDSKEMIVSAFEIEELSSSYYNNGCSLIQKRSVSRLEREIKNSGQASDQWRAENSTLIGIDYR